jgi:hypothetical protein
VQYIAKSVLLFYCIRDKADALLPFLRAVTFFRFVEEDQRLSQHAFHSLPAFGVMVGVGGHWDQQQN